MEHIKLSNEKEFQIKDIQQSGNQASITVIGIQDFASLRTELTPETLKVIEVYTEGGALCAVLEGYTDITGKFDIVETEDGTMDITVYLMKPDPVLQKLSELEAEIVELKALNN